MGTPPDPARADAANRALPRTSTVRREELIERIEGRFDARLTTIVGGAGVGKTTLLGQAMRSEGSCVDVWCPITVADRRGERMLARLADACADALDEYRPDPRSDSVESIVELLVSVAPDHVCLVLDDVHHLDAAADVDRLLTELPPNGHLLLCGRRVPAISTARLDTLGGLLRIRERDLLMSDEEIIEFARQRKVDTSALAAAERWPAFVELASRGGGSTPRDYLREEVFPALDAARRRGLAAFAVVGGGDDEISAAVTGFGIDALLHGVPLVRWTGDVAQLHDLWVDLLDEDIDDAERNRVSAIAAEIHNSRREFDAAVALRSATEDWVGLIGDIGTAIRVGVDGGLTAVELRRWLSLLPSDVDDPVITLAEGVIARERDPTAAVTAELLQRAAAGFRSVGDDEMELVAVLQLGYVARVGRDPSHLQPVIERLDALAATHRPARPFRAFGEAWAALMAFDNQAQLDALLPIADADLPPVWAASRDHLMANALFGLGRPNEALEIAPELEALDIPVPGALATRSQSLWLSGQPVEALAAVGGDHEQHGARDRFIVHVWSAAMLAWSGNVAAARRSRARGQQAAGALEAEITVFQMAGVDMLISLDEGHEADVAAMLRSILQNTPPGLGPVEQALRTHLAVPYVLVPDERERWDDLAGAGPAIQTTREIARAFLALRDGDAGLLGSIDWNDPAFVAVTLPHVWAVELGLRAIAAGEDVGGRRLIAWLCEHWGDPARAALRSWGDDPELAGHTEAVLAETPMPPPESTKLTVLGPSRLTVGDYPSDQRDWRRERVRALLVWLAVHRRGVRDHIAGELWPELSTDGAARNLRTTLNYLHGVLEPRRSARDATWYIRSDGPEISLHASLSVDLWRFVELLAEAERAESGGRVSDALPALVEAVGLYDGDLASDLDLSWLELERIHLRSRFVRASCRAAELLVAKRRPDEAVEIAKAALGIDPYHPGSYAVLASAYDGVGDASSARAVRRRGEERLAEV